MKAIRLTEAEAAVVEDALNSLAAGFDLPKKHPIHRIRAKLVNARAPSDNANVGPIEQALIAGARGKVIALGDGGGYGQCSVRAGKLGVTPEDARLVGEYFARTKWLTGPFTLLDILNKWPSHLAKARATQPPPSVPAGLGAGSAKAQTGSAGAGQGSTDQRPAPGFGRSSRNPYPDGTAGG